MLESLIKLSEAAREAHDTAREKGKHQLALELHMYGLMLAGLFARVAREEGHR